MLKKSSKYSEIVIFVKKLQYSAFVVKSTPNIVFIISNLSKPFEIANIMFDTTERLLAMLKKTKHSLQLYNHCIVDLLVKLIISSQ